MSMAALYYPMPAMYRHSLTVIRRRYRTHLPPPPVLDARLRGQAGSGGTYQPPLLSGEDQTEDGRAWTGLRAGVENLEHIIIGASLIAMDRLNAAL